MHENPKAKGERSEGLILAAFLQARKVVLLPFGDNQRYDMVVEEDGRFIRVQCKTGRLKSGCLVFDTCSSYAHRGGGKRGYKGEADLFAVYSPDLGKVYVVPVDVVGDRACQLRVDPAVGRQARNRNIRMAHTHDFEVNRDLSKLLG